MPPWGPDLEKKIFIYLKKKIIIIIAHANMTACSLLEIFHW